MRKIKQIRINTFPRWEVIEARKCEEVGGIEVKINMPHKNITGNLISKWLQMKMPYYWRGERRFNVKRIKSKDLNLILKGAKVRIPSLEQEHEDIIRKQQNKVYKTGGI